MSVFELVHEFFKQISSYVTNTYLLYGSIGLLLFMFIVSLIKTQYTYEVKLLRHISKLNRYFLNNPYINDDNLIFVNRKMKRVPKTLRYRWQEFMLNRDKAPSEYMNTVSCIDQPSKASTYNNATVTGGIFTFIIALLTFLIGLAKSFENGEVPSFHSTYYTIWLLPVVILVLGFLFVIFMRSRYTSVVADLYYEFHEFERNINKACTTLPQFIDYEVLFTKREIKEGIPVLQEYLEKRALQEKLEQDEMALNAFDYEQFDFSEIGVENSLLLERAMKESEKYFKVKNDLGSRVKSKETEMLNYQKNFEEVTKEYERKAQALRETLQQLTDQINNTTIKIEANYMKKRFHEEQQRLQQHEKDYELALTRFQKQQNELQSEIDTYRSELSRRKQLTQEAMMAEGKTYANKVYTLIAQTVQEQSRPYLEQIEENKNALETTIGELSIVIEERNAQLEELNNALIKTEQDYKNKLAGLEAVKSLKDYLHSEEFKQSFKKSEKDIDEAAKKLEIENKIDRLNKDIEDKRVEIEGLNKEKDKLLEQVNSLFEENQVLKEKLDNIKKDTQTKLEKSNKESVDTLKTIMENTTTNILNIDESVDKNLEVLKSSEVVMPVEVNTDKNKKDLKDDLDISKFSVFEATDEADEDNDNEDDGDVEQANSKKAKKLKRVKSKLDKLEVESKNEKELTEKTSDKSKGKSKNIEEDLENLDELNNLIQSENDKLIAQKSEFDNTVKQTIDVLDTFNIEELNVEDTKALKEIDLNENKNSKKSEGKAKEKPSEEEKFGLEMNVTAVEETTQPRSAKIRSSLSALIKAADKLDDKSKKD